MARTRYHDRPCDRVRRAAVQARRAARYCPACGGYSRQPGGHQTRAQCANWLAFDALREQQSAEASRVTAILFQRMSPK
jgi:NADH pyrophosphatase NudC (nudix superfamily)